MTPQTDPHRSLAVLSDGTFVCDDDHGHAGVIAAQQYPNDGVEISIRPLGPLPPYTNLEILIDHTDLAAINRLLRLQAADQQPDTPPADEEKCYDCRTTDERLADLEQRLSDLAIPGLRAHVNALDDRVAALEGKPQPLSAVDALRQIANIQARDPDGLRTTWAEMTARKAMDGA